MATPEDGLETDRKLDLIQDTTTALRVSFAELSGDVRASLARHDRQDVVSADVESRLRIIESTTATIPADVETRLRGLERRSYAVPSVGAVLGLAGFALSLWNNLH